MNTEVTVDLEDLQFSMESLLKQLPKLPLKQKIDVAARLKAIEKAVKSIDEQVKEEIKTRLRHKDGSIPGELFKANLALIPTMRLNQKALQIEQPKVYAKYQESTDQERITFEVR